METVCKYRDRKAVFVYLFIFGMEKEKESTYLGIKERKGDKEISLKYQLQSLGGEL